jgi:hypothetical protein
MKEGTDDGGAAVQVLWRFSMRSGFLVSKLARRALLAGIATLLCTAAPHLLLAQSSGSQPESKPTGNTILRIELTGGEAKKPIIDASVYLKFTEAKALRDKKIEYNLKTNQSGVARSPEIPKGRLLIQIVAPGWKTFGEYYDITQDEQTIQINLERPSTRWLRQ